MSNKCRIYVVEDHPIMRKGYRYLIDAEMDLEVCGEAGSAMGALAEIPEVEPDLIIVDISLEGMSGLELIKRLQSLYPDLLILIISAHDEALFGERGLRAGAHGYIMKSEVDDVVITAIRRVLEGGYFVSEEMNTRIMRQFQQGNWDLEDDASPIEHLSDREYEVFELMGRGMTTDEIGEALHISPKTVESHRRRVKIKLGIDSTNELMRRATLWVEQEK